MASKIVAQVGRGLPLIFFLEMRKPLEMSSRTFRFTESSNERTPPEERRGRGGRLCLISPLPGPLPARSSRGEGGDRPGHVQPPVHGKSESGGRCTKISA